MVNKFDNNFESTDFADYTDYSNHFKSDAKSTGLNSPQLAAIKLILHLKIHRACRGEVHSQFLPGVVMCSM